MLSTAVLFSSQDRAVQSCTQVRTKITDAVLHSTITLYLGVTFGMPIIGHRVNTSRLSGRASQSMLL